MEGILYGVVWNVALIDLKDVADLKSGHDAFLTKMDIIWIGVMSLSETHLCI